MLTLAACSNATKANQPTQICVGEQDVRVPESYCEDRNGGGSHFYRWYYFSRGGSIPYMGNRAFGGSPYPSGGGTYSRAPSASVSRGGFGSSVGVGGAGG